MHLALKSAMSRIPYTNKVGETLSSIADPAAAYSLRALGGGDPMVARVRRSSDDAEKDFTASDMDSGSVADWVNGKQETTLPCDVASAAAAYSLRSVNSNYTGSVVRVRRSSDDAEKDFSDVSLIADWVGSGNDGYVTTWYDQSGNGNNATQSTASSQPKIVDAGALVSDGIDFDGVDDFLDTGYSSGVASSQSLFAVFKVDLIDSSFRTPIDGRDANDDGIGFGVTTAIGFRFHVDADDVFATANTSLDLLTGIYGSSASAIYQKGALADSGLAPSTISVTTENYFIGKSPIGTSSLPLDGSISEIIIYDSDQSANRVAIETNINNYYDIY